MKQMKKAGADRVRKFLDLSTSHLPRKILDELVDGSEHGRFAVRGCIVYPYPDGLWLWVPDDPDGLAKEHDEDWQDEDDVDERYPQEVLKIQLFARNLGCDFVCLDSELVSVELLPLYMEE